MLVRAKRAAISVSRLASSASTLLVRVERVAISVSKSACEAFEATMLARAERLTISSSITFYKLIITSACLATSASRTLVESALDIAVRSVAGRVGTRFNLGPVTSRWAIWSTFCVNGGSSTLGVTGRAVAGTYLGLVGGTFDFFKTFGVKGFSSFAKDFS